MKLRLLFIVIFAWVSLGATTQLKEPKSDPYLDGTPKAPVVEDSTEVEVKTSSNNIAHPESVDIEEDVAPPRRILVPPKNTPGSTPSSSSFSVTRVRIDGKKSSSKAVQLISPRHGSTYTPGIITFTWKMNLPPKKKVTAILKVERLDGQKKYARRVYKEKKILDLSPGDYRWQVDLGKGQESRWRLLKIQEAKSHSLTDLYQDSSKKNKKPKPVISAYINEVDDEGDSDMDETDPRLPASEPLEVPSWAVKSKANP